MLELMGSSILKPQWKKFADQYLLTGSCEKSAISAGFARKGARTQGARLLRQATVAEYIAAQQAKLTAKTESMQDRILAELERIAFANLDDFVTIDDDGEAHVDLSKATREQMAALNKLETKTRKIYTPKGEHIATEHHTKIGKDDKLRGLQLLGQTLGMFKSDEVKVTVDVADRLLAARQRVMRLPAPTDDEGA
jgi:phage terminase small subunit